MSDFEKKVGIKTGIGVGSSVLGLGTGALIRAFQNINPEFAKRWGQQQLARYNKMMLTIRGTCRSAAYQNINEENIIKQLICKIIQNESQDEQGLSDETLISLAAILNNSGKYFAITNQEKQKQENAAAIGAVTTATTTAAANTLGNAVLDSYAASKDVVSSNIAKATTPGDTQTEKFNNSFGYGAPAVALAAALSYVGIKSFFELNKIVPNKYKPDLSFLFTAITERNKEIADLEEHKSNCLETYKKEIIEQFIEEFSKDNTIDFMELDNVESQRGKFKLFKGEIDFETNTFKNLPKPIETYINEKCKMFNSGIDDIKNQKLAEINEIQNVINSYARLFNIRDIDLRNPSKELKEYAESLRFEPVNMDTIQAIKTKINTLRDEITAKNILIREETNPMIAEAQKTAVNTGREINTVRGQAAEKLDCFGKMCKSALGFGKGGRKHRKSRRLRKRKTQKRRIRTHRRH